MRKCVILWQRFGPYHLARLRGAAERLGREGVGVVGVEVAREDEYPWRKCQVSGVKCQESDAPLSLHTLFPSADYRSLSRREIRDAVRTALDEIGPEAVLINGWSVPEAVAALRWCKRRGAKGILASESQAPERRNPIKELVKSWRVKSFDAALVGGRPHAEYVQRLGMSANRVFLGYDAVDNAYFAGGAGEAQSAWRKEHGEEDGGPRAEIRGQRSEVGGRRAEVGASGIESPNDLLNQELTTKNQEPRTKNQEPRTSIQLPLPPFFFANCRFIKRKNIDGLLRAYALYRKQVPEPWNLVISGSGEEEEALKRLAKSLGLMTDDRRQMTENREDRAGSGLQLSVLCPLSSVVFPGFLQYDELPTYYGLASVFIHPAKSEPWGLVVNEACASGLPVLVSRTVGARYELVEEGVNGFLFDPFSDEEMAAAMGRMTKLSEAERQRMGDRSREIVAAFGPARFGQGLFSALTAIGIGMTGNDPKTGSED